MNLAEYVHAQEIDPEVFQLCLVEMTISQQLLQVFGAQRKLGADDAGIRCGTELAASVEGLQPHDDVFVDELPGCCDT